MKRRLLGVLVLAVLATSSHAGKIDQMMRKEIALSVADSDRYPPAIGYGAEYDDEYIKQALQKTGLLAKAKQLDAIEGEIGELISKGKIIARFGGRDEWGPRALGNRRKRNVCSCEAPMERVR